MFWGYQKIFERKKTLDGTYSTRLPTALAASLLLHILAFLTISPSSSSTPLQQLSPLNVRLTRMPTPSPDIPSITEAIAPPLLSLATPLSPRISSVNPAETAISGNDASQLDMPPSPAAPLPPEPAATHEPDTVTPFRITRLLTTPTLVNIEYEIFTGQDRKPLGTGQQRYMADESNHYEITYQSSGKSPDPWSIAINGQIRHNQLLPANYAKIGSLAGNITALDSNHSDNLSPIASQAGKMPDGILDRLSLQYRFMNSPPTEDEGKIWLSDGSSLAEFSYRISGHEMLLLGEQSTAINTLHLVLTKSNATAPTIELWLAPDFHYIAVKTLLNSDSGAILEQRATKISIEK